VRRGKQENRFVTFSRPFVDIRRFLVSSKRFSSRKDAATAENAPQIGFSLRAHSVSARDTAFRIGRNSPAAWIPRTVKFRHNIAAQIHRKKPVSRKDGASAENPQNQRSSAAMPTAHFLLFREGFLRSRGTSDVWLRQHSVGGLRDENFRLITPQTVRNPHFPPPLVLRGFGG